MEDIEGAAGSGEGSVRLRSGRGSASAVAAKRRVAAADVDCVRPRPHPVRAKPLLLGMTKLVLAHSFPADHRRRIRSTNPLERISREIGWRTDVVGTYPTTGTPASPPAS